MHFFRILAVFLTLSLFLLPIKSSANENGASAQLLPNKAVTTNGFQYSIEPMPTWISLPQTVNNKPSNSSMYYEMVDEEIMVDEDSTTEFKYVVRVIEKSSGLDNATHIKAMFDPTYQSLVFHTVEIIRDGKHLDKLANNQLQLLQRETGLEAKMYDGRVTANLVLDDVRVGDKVAFAYSVRGANPVFNGMFSYIDWIPSSIGVINNYQFRLLMPKNRPVNIHAGSAYKIETSIENQKAVTLVTGQYVPQFNYDESTSVFSYFDQQVQVSEFENWAEVANWGDALFNLPSDSLVKLKADEIRQQASTTNDQVLKALDFVQKEIRYLGMEIGQNSHKPNNPDLVIKQRFGDCKDKTVLLIALLKALGVEAKPVLVSTNYHENVDQYLPSPLVFNHVIAQVNIQGESYFLDGTRQSQTGRLSGRESKWYGNGLTLDNSVDRLTKLPNAVGELQIVVNDVVNVHAFTKPPTLTSTITYYGGLAESMRNAVATGAHHKLDQFFSENYVRHYPKIRKTKSFELVEVDGENAVNIVQTFTLPEFWDNTDHNYLKTNFVYWNVVNALEHPKEQSRNIPFKISYPGTFKHIYTINFPEPVFEPSNAREFTEKNDIFDYQVDRIFLDSQSTITSTLTFLKNAVSEAQWTTFVERNLAASTWLSSSIRVSLVKLSEGDSIKKEVAEIESTMQSAVESGQYTNEQVMAKMHIRFINAQLSSNRLKPEFKAKALTRLGYQYYVLGDNPSAEASYEEAIKLAPGDIGLYLLASSNALYLNHDEKARAYSMKALSVAPNQLLGYRVLAMIKYLQHDFVGAKQDIAKYIESKDDNKNGYGNLLLYFSMLRNGDDVVNNIAAYNLKEETEDNKWVSTVLKVLKGELPFSEVEQALKLGGTYQSNLSELYYYVGEKFLIEGNKERAQELFSKSIVTGVQMNDAKMMAKRSLDEI